MERAYVCVVELNSLNWCEDDGKLRLRATGEQASEGQGLRHGPSETLSTVDWSFNYVTKLDFIIEDIEVVDSTLALQQWTAVGARARQQCPRLKVFTISQYVSAATSSGLTEALAGELAERFRVAVEAGARCKGNYSIVGF